MDNLINIFLSNWIVIFAIVIFLLIAITFFLLDEVLEKGRSFLKLKWHQFRIKRLIKKFTDEDPVLRKKIHDSMRMIAILEPTRNPEHSYATINAILERESLNKETIRELLKTVLFFKSRDPAFLSLLRIICTNINKKC